MPKAQFVTLHFRDCMARLNPDKPPLLLNMLLPGEHFSIEQRSTVQRAVTSLNAFSVPSQICLQLPKLRLAWHGLSSPARSDSPIPLWRIESQYTCRSLAITAWPGCVLCTVQHAPVDIAYCPMASAVDTWPHLCDREETYIFTSDVGQFRVDLRQRLQRCSRHWHGKPAIIFFGEFS